MGYRIKTVADLLGVPRNTLLAWERRYNIVTPMRQENGYREYSEDDVERLRALKRMIDTGYRAGEAISLLAEQAAVAQPDAAQAATEDTCEALLEILLSLDRRGADELLRRASATLSFEQQIDRIYFPLLRHVGDLWAEEALTVAQEHLVSQFCREHLQGMLVSLDHGPASGRLAVCAAFPDEDHDIPLLGLAVRLALRGYRILFLGARVPTGSLQELIAAHQPGLVCVSLTIPRPPKQILEVAQALSSVAIRGAIVIGGAGLPAGLPEVPGVRWARRTRDFLDDGAVSLGGR